MFETSEPNNIFSRSNLIKEQQNGLEISVIYIKASDEKDATNDPISYFMKNRVLMRKWHPLDISADNEGAFRHLIIIQKSYRTEILSLAHNTPLSGHLGINKTLQKINTH